MANGRNPEHIRNIALDIIFALLTCGLYNIWVQARQMYAVNEMIGQDKYSFLPWLLFSLVTCGIYHIYHEYRMSTDIAATTGGSDNDPLISVVLCIFGLLLVVDAIQQSQINRYYGSEAL